LPLPAGPEIISGMRQDSGMVPFQDGHTWYRITGPLASDRAPLVVAHGGPGGGHDYLVGLTALADDDRAVILYDQFGCGNSSRRPGWPPDRWTIDLFVSELAALVGHLRVDGGFHLLGHSWGGLLATEYALTYPFELRSLVLADTGASIPLIEESVATLIDRIEPDVAETPGTPEHEQAVTDLFTARHMCRLDPLPAEVARTFDQARTDTTVLAAVMGLTSDGVTGTMAGWSAVDRLHELTMPTLVVAGTYDEIMPFAWEPFAQRIPHVATHVFAESSHMPHVEEPDAYLRVLRDFLSAHD
jgi:L-proline amide hydrolase